MADVPIPIDLGRVTHLHQMHRTEDDAGDPIPAGLLLGADGARGHTYFDPAVVAAGGSMVPYWIPLADTFTVPLYKQALFSETIDGPGTLDVIGMLIEVD